VKNRIEVVYYYERKTGIKTLKEEIYLIYILQENDFN